jgi:Holliday junction resolvasome RuvABC endonuclease subunit
MVCRLLNLDGAPSVDAADALAAALCHANQRRIQRALGTAALAAGLE